MVRTVISARALAALVATVAVACGQSSTPTGDSYGPRVTWVGSSVSFDPADPRARAIESLPDRLRDRATAWQRRFPGTLDGVDIRLEVADPPLGATDRLAALLPAAGETTSREMHLVVLPPALERGEAGLQAILDHELVHVVHRRALGEAMRDVPRWLREGLAVVLSGETETVIARAAATQGLGRDPRRDPPPPLPDDDELIGALRLQSLARHAGWTVERAEHAWIQCLHEPEPMTTLAELTDADASTLVDLADRLARARWLEVVGRGWSDLAFVRDVVGGAPLHRAGRALAEFAQSFPDSPYRAELEIALLERDLAAGEPNAHDTLDAWSRRRNDLPDPLLNRLAAAEERIRAAGW